MKRFLSAPVVALAVFLFAGTWAQASPLPIDQVFWTYDWSSVSPSDNTTLAPAVFSDTNPGAGINMSNEPIQGTSGNTDTVAANLKVFSAATRTSPDVLSTNGAYSLRLRLKMNEGGTDYYGELYFTGKLSGEFSQEHSLVGNVFTSATTQSVMLGSYNFTVSQLAYTPPPGPNSSKLGAISARVDLTIAQVSNEPEPSTMILGSLGLSMLGGMAWRKRRQARAAVVA